jgi:hypothetical protein
MILNRRFFIFPLTALLLNACTGLQPTPSGEQLPAGADQPTLEEVASFQQQAQHFAQLAAQSVGQARNQHLLRAADLYIEAGDYEAARQQLDAMDTSIAETGSLHYRQMLSARILLGLGKPREALGLLDFAAILPEEQQIQLYAIRAQAFLDAGYPLEAAKTRMQLDTLLSDPVQRDQNHQAIWEILSLLPATTLNQLSQAPLNPVFLGWVELAKIAKRGQIDWQNLQDDMFRWRQRYPQHPAARVFIDELGKQQVELMDRPAHIAVLLPLTGPYGQVAGAIRDGFMTAFYQHPDKTLRPRISFYDTGRNPAAVWNHYRQAVDQGADFVVGPFLKSAVDKLAQAPQLEVPTLTLNYATHQQEIITNLYQFGLLPEDEARQVAEMAFRQGHLHAAVLVPQGDWGQRLNTAFQQRFEELGGNLVRAQTYSPGANDFKRPIQSLLNINQSYARYNKLRRVVHSDLKFTPYRRQDVDMIFMAATPRDARQLKPQFKFHYAGELPVYATSHAYTGKRDANADRDIDDLYYCDMPWILNPAPHLKQALLTYWPEQQQYTRFFALGTDAYNLIPFMGRLQAKSYERFSGQTGNIYLDPFRRLHRELLWAQFVRGEPVLIDLNTLPENILLDQTGLSQ